MTFLAAERWSSKLFAVVLLATENILLPFITIVVLGSGKAPVPSITVAFSRIIIPELLYVNIWFGATEKLGWLTLAKAEDILGEIYIKNIATIAIDMTEDSVILFLTI